MFKLELSPKSLFLFLIPTELSPQKVWSTRYWTIFTIFWTDLHFCKCIWNVINFFLAKDVAVVSTFFKQIGRLLMWFDSVCIPSCHDHTLELLRVRLTIFADVCGISVVANDQYASLKLAEKRKKNDNLLKAIKILKSKYKIVGGRLLRLACQRGEICPTPHPPLVTPLQQTL